MAGSVVGIFSLLGGLIIGGKSGAIIGGSVGHQISNVLIPRIRNVGNMLRKLAADQLRNLLNLLTGGIQNTVSAVLGQIVNQNLRFTDLLERFGGISEVRMIIIQTLIRFFSDIYGGTICKVTS